MPDVILPALNEAAAVAWVLGRMPAGFHPIVVDNGSTDSTAELAASHGATVVSEPVRGFGSACWAGVQAATDDIICFMDCDASLVVDRLHRSRRRRSGDGRTHCSPWGVASTRANRQPGVGS
jgi:glycosyltransferase involved in cell wall biosynthesis